MKFPPVQHSHRHRSQADGHRSEPPPEAAGADSRPDPGCGGVLAPVSRAGTAMIRAAAMLAWFTGLCFGLPGSYAIWYLADRRHIWTFLGFPTYGAGPFENIGIKTTVPLLIVFLLVCVAELAAGWLLWQRRRAGAVLALLPAEFAFWIGFALPLGPWQGWPGRCWCCWAGRR